MEVLLALDIERMAGDVLAKMCGHMIAAPNVPSLEFQKQSVRYAKPFAHIESYARIGERVLKRTDLAMCRSVVVEESESGCDVIQKIVVPSKTSF